MKFIVSSTSLLKELQAISGVLNTNNTLPILDNFLFKISKNSLVISASDLETTISSVITIEATEDGNIAIPARLLLDTLKTFPEQPLTFDADVKTNSIEISSDFGKYKLAGHNADEFPKLPSVDSSTFIDIKPDVLLDALNSTLFATGNDELRPVMSGVLCEISPEDVTFVATDAHKLVKYRRTDSSADELTSFILPKKPLNLLKSILGGEQSDVRIEYNKSNALFSFGNINLICRLIDGNYPNYSAVIPDKNPNKLVIDRETLLGSITRVSIFSNKTTHQVKLDIKGSELNISAEDLDYSNEATERLTCEYDGEDLEIAFNARFLIEMLSNIDSDEIMIELATSNKAGIILPQGNDNEKEKEILMLIMPVMLNT
ncbi:MAG: DNA polymerase III subunit beta [Bacteroidetes bacterium]|nr:DNA polymerase III subunit beta [Bacteroidota bacterium]